MSVFIVTALPIVWFFSTTRNFEKFKISTYIYQFKRSEICRSLCVIYIFHKIDTGWWLKTNYIKTHIPIPINSLWGLAPSLPRLAAASTGASCVAFVGQTSWWCMCLGLPGHRVKGHHQATFLVVHPIDQGIMYWRLNRCTWFSSMSIQKMM